MNLIKKIIKYIYLKIKWGETCKFGLLTNISQESTFEGICQIHPHTTFHGHIGIGSYIGPYSSLSAEIGRFTSIAPYVRTNCGIHPYKEPFVSTSPCFFSLNPNKTQCGSTFAKRQMLQENKYYNKEKKIAIKIGSDCWIGEGAFLVGGIEIADGAVVLAHAVVTKNVPPFAIVGGVPAKIIRYRYDEETIQFLLKVKWWNKPVKWVKENWELFSDLDKFKKHFSENL